LSSVGSSESLELRARSVIATSRVTPDFVSRTSPIFCLSGLHLDHSGCRTPASHRSSHFNIVGDTFSCSSPTDKVCACAPAPRHDPLSFIFHLHMHSLVPYRAVYKSAVTVAFSLFHINIISYPLQSLPLRLTSKRELTHLSRSRLTPSSIDSLDLNGTSTASTIPNPIMEGIQTHPSNAAQAKAFTAPGSLSFPGASHELTPPLSNPGNVQQPALNGQQVANGAAVTPATPAATPAANQGPSGITPTLQYVFS
jgi:hypothetical protein